MDLLCSSNNVDTKLRLAIEVLDFHNMACFEVCRFCEITQGRTKLLIIINFNHQRVSLTNFVPDDRSIPMTRFGRVY